ncbi:DUF1488 family protein [Paraburkholderia phenoliruptrix]|uniref:DUF1488 domain-containing protein n=1 Tax=Paraburkholderia phenoliruptrix TaxID=252970 RepID=UPI002869B917|nr:DUF1488 domain-containing protein [Paraburkholderia phenoliruptrix]WMY08270.1 DUF1488 domain-containing protein [Paraburkholderia phenoliruptrix]
MTKKVVGLSFPNPNRSYDASRRCVCFWGYDKAREIAFLVDGQMLMKLNPGTRSEETDLLAAFDRSRDQIRELAETLYKGGQQIRYVIS